MSAYSTTPGCQHLANINANSNANNDQTPMQATTEKWSRTCPEASDMKATIA